MKKLLFICMASIITIGSLTMVGFAATANDNATSGMREVDVNANGTKYHEYVGGGEWWWGIDDSRTVFSDYYHPTNRHSSTALNGNGQGERKVAEPGQISYAKAPATLTGNKAYWNNVA